MFSGLHLTRYCQALRLERWARTVPAPGALQQKIIVEEMPQN